MKRKGNLYEDIISIYKNESLKDNPFQFGQMEYLIVQLYQPTTHLSLISKLLKFSEFLFGIKEYDEVLNFLKCIPETIGDLKKNNNKY